MLLLFALLASIAGRMQVPPAAASPPSPTPVPAPSATASPAAPRLVARPAFVNLNPEMAAAVRILGANGAITASLDKRIVRVSVDERSDTVVLTAGGQTGSAILHVTDAVGAAVDVPVRVAFNAGTFAPSITLQVTGDPLDATWLQQQIYAAVARATLVAPGAGAPQFGPFVTPPALAPGSSAVVPVNVQISGNATYFDVKALTSVTVQNVAVPPFSPGILFYDDDPEKIEASGVLYRGRIRAGQPVRLYFYHENAGRPHRLVLALLADSQDPTSIQAIDATAGPSQDVLSVGHAVTRTFLLMKPADEGLIVPLPQELTYELQDVPLGDLDGVAGNVDLRVVSGGSVEVAVLSVPPDATPLQIAQLFGQPRLPGDGHHRTGVFAIGSGYGDRTLAYAVGGPDASTVYGAGSPPSLAPQADWHDYGGYGVLHRIVFELSNPTPQPATIYLYERPLGGVVRSSFLVDGTLHEVGCARVSDRYEIAALALDPGQNLTSTVLTMTDGGSSYPLEIGASTTVPLPTTPPITAPEGCFPKAGAASPPSPPVAPASPVPSPLPSALPPAP